MRHIASAGQASIADGRRSLVQNLPAASKVAKSALLRARCQIFWTGGSLVSTDSGEISKHQVG